jgi:hypothetical protein
MTELVVANTESYSTPSKVTVVVNGIWYDESSPPSVVTTMTTGSVVSFAYVGVAKNTGIKAIEIAAKNLGFLILGSPC